MQCPKCNHEPNMSDMLASPGTCPNCGVIYEKYIAAMKASLKAKTQPGQAAPLKNKSAVTVKDSSGHVQEVVVADIRMSFMSMVTFMVKWAFAAIPAMVIIAMIWVVIIMTVKTAFFS